MNTLVVFGFLVASVSALGSGPYLPSGWKPEGPAFLLPTEVEKPSQQSDIEKPNQEVKEVESPIEEPALESEGSNFLREYGPPINQDIYQSVTNQFLPDVYTERAFAVTEEVNTYEGDVTTEIIETEALEQVRSNLYTSAEEINNEINTSKDENTKVENNVVEGESTTELDSTNDQTTETVVDITTTELKADLTTESLSTSEDVNAIVNYNQTAEETGEEEGTSSNVNGNNAVADSEETDKTGEQSEEQQEDLHNESTTKAKEESGTSKAAPVVDVNDNVGFREYGPPKNDESNEDRIEGNETRKRRFSSKFSFFRKQ